MGTAHGFSRDGGCTALHVHSHEHSLVDRVEGRGQWSTPESVTRKRGVLWLHGSARKDERARVVFAELVHGGCDCGAADDCGVGGSAAAVRREKANNVGF